MHLTRICRQLAIAAAVLQAAALMASDAAADSPHSLDRTVTQWAPMVEWSLKNNSCKDHPFDLIATVTFSHEATGSIIRARFRGTVVWTIRVMNIIDRPTTSTLPRCEPFPGILFFPKTAFVFANPHRMPPRTTPWNKRAAACGIQPCLVELPISGVT